MRSPTVTFSRHASGNLFNKRMSRGMCSEGLVRSFGFERTEVSGLAGVKFSLRMRLVGGGANKHALCLRYRTGDGDARWRYPLVYAFKYWDTPEVDYWVHDMIMGFVHPGANLVWLVCTPIYKKAEPNES